jgi:hypothetical protein
MFAMTAWNIWRKRNLQLWEDKKETVQQVIGRAQGMLQHGSTLAKQMQQAEDNNRFIMLCGSLHQQDIV